MQLGSRAGAGGGDAIRRQLLAVGARHSLAPVLDVARDPRWGRLEETYGEDPVLAGVLGDRLRAGHADRRLVRRRPGDREALPGLRPIGGWAQLCAGTGRAKGAA